MSTTEKIGDLKGPVLKGKCEIVFFSSEDFSENLFAKKDSEVKEWFESSCTLEKSFNPVGIVFDGKNNHLAIRKGKKVIVYGWSDANGPHPDRWQDTDDFTDWLSEIL